MGRIGFLDGLVFVGYFVAVIFIGFWVGRHKKKSAHDFFLTANKLPWYVVGFSIIAAGISTEQFLGTTGFAYRHGLAVANWEWINGPSLIVLILIFVPFYIRRKITTMPHFLEKRYGGGMRTMFAIITILTYIFINLAGVAFSGGFALNKIFGINLYVGIWGMTLIAGAYTIYGGMASVAWTQVLQSILLLGGGLLVFFLGLYKVGDFNAILGVGSRAHLILPATDPHLPGTGMIVLALSTNIWYYCTNQCINQTVLGAKNEWHAKMGIIFAGLLWVLLAFSTVLPGMIAFVLNPNLPTADEAFPFIVKTLIPVGLKGIIFAGLCGAVMSTIEALINATSTVFTFDIYQRFIKKDASDKDLIKTGRICGTVVLVFGALWAPMVLKFGHIFSYFQECWAFIAVPAAVVFLGGVLWKRITNTAALWTLGLSFPMLILPYVLRILKVKMNVFNIAGIIFILTVIFIIVVSLYTKPPEEEKVKDYVWNFSMRKLPSEELAKGYPWYKSILVWTILMVSIYLVIYIKFW